MNKILEAILKGILMGLEILDDELDLTTFLKSELTSDYHADRAEQIKWIRDNFVDLGLPSGNLWCKYNLGATCRNTAKSWYGDYYAWGEIEVKKDFKLLTYKYHKKRFNMPTKYNSDDKKRILDPEDDAVNVALGKEFRMPSREDFEELYSLPNEWVKDYNGVKGLNGRIFTGNNGNEMFVPAAGDLHGCRANNDGCCCYMWSRSLNIYKPDTAYYMYLNRGGAEEGWCAREVGHTVRGII